MLKGFTKSCDTQQVAGIKKIGLIPAKSITAVSFDTDNADDIKTVTMKAAEVFAKYEFQEDECEFQENYKVENGIRSVEQKLIFKLTTMSSQTRAAVEEIAQASGCGLVAAVFLPSGEILLPGWDKSFDGERPLRLQSTTGTTGKKLSDVAGEEITMGRETTVKAHHYIGDGTALFTPAS